MQSLTTGLLFSITGVTCRARLEDSWQCHFAAPRVNSVSLAYEARLS